jgi:hypothetical protein
MKQIPPAIGTDDRGRLARKAVGGANHVDAVAEQIAQLDRCANFFEILRRIKKDSLPASRDEQVHRIRRRPRDHFDTEDHAE